MQGNRQRGHKTRVKGIRVKGGHMSQGADHITDKAGHQTQTQIKGYGSKKNYEFRK